jgi:hypothetical protein
MPDADIDGLWTGYYLDRNEKHGLVARFAQSGEELRGAMVDDVLRFEYPLDECARMNGWSEDDLEAQRADVYSWAPDAAGEPITFVVRLPEQSEIDGRVRGQVVRFRKTYLGVAWQGWRVGSYKFGDEYEPDPVEYDGTLSDDGTQIGGRWRIAPDPDRGHNGTSGVFEFWRWADKTEPT